MGDARPAYEHPYSVAALAGSPPSPANRQAPRRALPLACNKRFRVAITTFADNSRHASPWPPRSTTTPAPAAKTTRTPSASSPAPGSCHMALLVDGVPDDPAAHGTVAALAEQIAA